MTDDNQAKGAAGDVPAAVAARGWAHLGTLNLLYQTLVSAAESSQEAARAYHQASKLAHGIHMLDDPNVVIKSREAITAMSKASGKPTHMLIPKDKFWSSEQGQAMSREEIMAWATGNNEIAGDRFWPTTNGFVGIACLSTKVGPYWMLNASDHGIWQGNQTCNDAFEMMIFFDIWVQKLKERANADRSQC